MLRFLIAGAAFIAILAGAAALVIVPRVTAQGETRQEPVAFSHRIHIEKAGVTCLFCHRNADKGKAAGIPAVEQCMFCHSVVSLDKPEVQKVRSAWENREPLNWIKDFRLPDHTHFIHEPHIRKEIACATCHGEVEKMDQARPVITLEMRDCVSCHRQRGAPTDCANCHY